MSTDRSNTSRRLQLSKGLETEDVANLHVCQWQNHKKVSLLYLIYRWISAIFLLTILVCSVLDVGRSLEEKFEGHQAKWWIYLTHWTVLICVVQGWLAVLICTKEFLDYIRHEGVVLQSKISCIQQIYWICYSVGTVYSFIISFLYWFTVHDPENDSFDLINLLNHSVLALLMLVDLLLVGHPIRINPDLYFSIGLGLAYSLFSLAYFLAGGTDRKLKTNIYPQVNWEKPESTILACFESDVCVFVMHIICYGICKVRVLIHKNFFDKKEILRTSKEHSKMLDINSIPTV